MSEPAAALLLAVSLAAAAESFRRIVRRYGTLLGFPWMPSLGFAAASVAAVYALHILAGP